jgi:hypothetical protein
MIEKILLPASGYVARMLQTGIGRSRMRRQLYREIARNYHKLDLQIHLATSIPGIRQGAPFQFAERTDISFDYDHLNRVTMDLPGYAHVRAKEALAEIEEASAIGPRRLGRAPLLNIALGKEYRPTFERLNT